MSRRLYKLIAFLFFILSTAVVPQLLLAAPNHIVINEAQLSGVTSKDEFVELYNPTPSAVNLNGWRLSKQTASGSQSNLLTTFPDVDLAPGQHFLITHPTDYTGSSTADATYSTSGSLADNNAVILFSDAGTTVVDTIGFGSANTFEGSAVANPDDNESVSRLQQGNAPVDTDNNAADLELLTNPTPLGMESSGASSVPQSSTGTPLQESDPVDRPYDVVINELMIDPPDGDLEWVELANRTGKQLVIDGWSLTDGSGTRTNLSGTLGPSIGDERWLLIENPNGTFNNIADEIVLRGADGTIIDVVAYGDWPDSRIDDNAPLASNGNALARRIDGLTTGSNFADFVVTASPTPGVANNITDPADPLTASGFMISELLPNPVGSDQQEFIELTNTTTEPVELTGWRIRDASGNEITLSPLELDNTTLEPKQRLSLGRELTGLALDNTGDETIWLYPPNQEEAVQTIRYVNATEGEAYAFIGNVWRWTVIPTPGAKNLHAPPDRAPVPVIYAPLSAETNEGITLSAEDTTGLGPLTYQWQFGDDTAATGEIVTHKFSENGRFTITLTATNARGTSATTTTQITIGDTTVTPLILGASHSGSVTLSELLPRPAAGDIEWIELTNNDTAPADIAGWQIGDASTKRYTFPQPTTIAPGGFLQLTKTTSGLALNDDGDSVWLQNSAGVIVDQVQYGSATQGHSFAWDNVLGWRWTSSPTPTTTNSFAPSGVVRGATTGFITGIVTAAPGEIDTHVMYLGAVEGLEGRFAVRVDLPKELLPSLTQGDRISVAGKLRTVSGEPRLSVTDLTSLAVLDHGHTPPSPLTFTTTDLNDDLGMLVSASGVIDRGTTGGFVLLADNNEELRVIMPASASDNRPFPTGTEIEVVGLLSKTSAGPRLMIRSQSDITVAASAFAVAEPPSVSKTDRRPLALGIVGFVAVLSAGLYRWSTAGSFMTPKNNLPFDIVDEEDTV